jgi:hypothetical protein
MIQETLSNAIRSLSKKHEVEPVDLRIKISKKKDSLRYEIMQKTDVLEETNLATALNLNTIAAFMVGNRLNTIMDGLIKQYNVSEDTINVRIYTKTDDCEPMLYLFDGGKPKQPLDIKEFT